MPSGTGVVMGANGPKGAHIPDVLLDPLRDRGVAFTEAEREAHGLTGRLPSAVLTLDQQASRAYKQMERQPDDLAKNVYLEQLHDATRPSTTSFSWTTSPSSCRSSTTQPSATPSSATRTSTAGPAGSTCRSTGPTTSRTRATRW